MELESKCPNPLRDLLKPNSMPKQLIVDPRTMAVGPLMNGLGFLKNSGGHIDRSSSVSFSFFQRVCSIRIWGKLIRALSSCTKLGFRKGKNSIGIVL